MSEVAGESKATSGEDKELLKDLTQQLHEAHQQLRDHGIKIISAKHDASKKVSESKQFIQLKNLLESKNKQVCSSLVYYSFCFIKFIIVKIASLREQLKKFETTDDIVEVRTF